MRASGSMWRQALYWRRAVFQGGLSIPGGKREAAIAVGLAGALAVAIFLWRRGPALTPARLRRRSPVSVYERMLKRLARLGLRPGHAETAREFCGRAVLRLPDRRDAVGELTRVYEAVRFGGLALGEKELARLWQLADGLTTPTSGAPRG